jgi:hypothetical protein
MCIFCKQGEEGLGPVRGSVGRGVIWKGGQNPENRYHKVSITANINLSLGTIILFYFLGIIH